MPPYGNGWTLTHREGCRRIGNDGACCVGKDDIAVKQRISGSIAVGEFEREVLAYPQTSVHSDDPILVIRKGIVGHKRASEVKLRAPGPAFHTDIETV